MKIKLLTFLLLILLGNNFFAQNSKFKKFKMLSAPEKCWVIFHPFVAKKALRVSEFAREETKNIIDEKMLTGDGNSGQVDAFRHTFWMAMLALEIGSKKARSLGGAHEKGNYKTYKKGRLEDGVLPDKISSEMDLFNNQVGIEIAELTTDYHLKGVIINAVKDGKCKIIKRDKKGNYLDCEDKILLKDSLNGKWENKKCLVWSNEI